MNTENIFSSFARTSSGRKCDSIAQLSLPSVGETTAQQQTTALMCALLCAIFCRPTMKLIAPQAPHTALFSNLLRPGIEKHNSRKD